MEKNICSLFFHIFPCFLNLFHQKVWVKYQQGALNTCLLVKNLITNIRTKFKVFQILFPLFSPYFIIFSHFDNVFRFSGYYIFWKMYSNGKSVSSPLLQNMYYKDTFNFAYIVHSGLFFSCYFRFMKLIKNSTVYIISK